MANSRTAVGIKDTKRTVKHPFETTPPAHERVVVNDDNWNLAETALPVTTSHVSSHAGDARANNCGNDSAMNPVYTDHDSAYIEDSHTDGKRR